LYTIVCSFTVKLVILMLRLFIAHPHKDDQKCTSIFSFTNAVTHTYCKCLIKRALTLWFIILMCARCWSPETRPKHKKLYVYVNTRRYSEGSPFTYIPVYLSSSSRKKLVDSTNAMHSLASTLRKFSVMYFTCKDFRRY